MCGQYKPVQSIAQKQRKAQIVHRQAHNYGYCRFDWFPVSTADLERMPVSSVVSIVLEIVRNRHNRRAAEVLEHIDVDMDSVFHIHPYSQIQDVTRQISHE